jgi:non-heme chloroperoxidase
VVVGGSSADSIALGDAQVLATGVRVPGGARSRREPHVPASGAPLFQAATANLNPFGGETALDVRNPDRGPLLIIAGTKDNTAPIAFTHGSYKLQKRNESVTEYVEIEDRGHSLVIDHGWPDVAAAALAFVRRFA